MPTQIAKKRFVPNVPVRAGTLYKVSVNSRDYIVKAKYDKTLSQFNAMWFINESPKQYFLSQSDFDNFTGVLMPQDEIIVNGIKFKNEQIGALTKPELSVIFNPYKEERLVSGLVLTGAEDHRTHKFKIRPFRNDNCEEFKYYLIDNWTRTPSISVFKLNSVQTIVFQVTETFVPARASSATTHACIINHTGFIVSYQGVTPFSSTSNTTIYAIPNILTSKKLTIFPNGVNSIILKFE